MDAPRSGRRVLAAPDKFRGTASAPEVAAAIARAAIAAGWTCDEAPVADGGEGTLDAFGGRVRRPVRPGPVGPPGEAGGRPGGGEAGGGVAAASGRTPGASA